MSLSKTLNPSFTPILLASDGLTPRPPSRGLTLQQLRPSNQSRRLTAPAGLSGDAGSAVRGSGKAALRVESPLRGGRGAPPQRRHGQVLLDPVEFAREHDDTILIALLSGTILGTTMLAQRDTARVMSRSLLSQTIDQTVERLHRFFDPVVPTLLLLRSWSEAGLLDTDAADAMNRLLPPVMTPYPQISAILAADARGREHMLLHDGDRWHNRQTRRDVWGARTRWLEWTTGEPTPSMTWREVDYDPRKRPWYRAAVEHRKAVAGGSANDLVMWTAPYPFFTLEAPGITAATAFEVGGVPRVVGIDVLLSEISIYTMHLRPSSRGVVVVLADDGRVIGLPRSPRFDDARARRAALLAPPTALDMPALGDGVHALAARGDARGPARFASAGEPWWGETQRFELAPG